MYFVPSAALLLLAGLISPPQPCQSFHGRAWHSSADGMFRIWHIGTRHEFLPDTHGRDSDDVEGTSWEYLLDMLSGFHKDDAHTPTLSCARQVLT
jgi:hypothetical protein